MNIIAYHYDKGGFCAMPKRLPATGEKYFFKQEEVTVMRVWDCFHLVEIKDRTSRQPLCVDICTLTDEPDFTNTISLKYFGKDTNERSAFY